MSAADDFPDDSDGDALRRVVSHGADLSRPMTIDFHVAAPNEATAKAIAQAASKLGYQTKIYDSQECGGWTCQYSTRMIASYQGVIAIQRELGEISVPLGGYPDGWGTFGNGREIPG